MHTTLDSYIQHLHQEHRYRTFIPLERDNPPYALFHHNGSTQRVVVWCSNDYLGLSHHPRMVQAHTQAALHYGTGSGGTRNIAGTSILHEQLEHAIADLHQQEKGLLFSSGYVANEATLSTLGNFIENLTFFSDEKVHASMIQGMRHSKAKRVIFAHNDLTDLEIKLKQTPGPKMIVFVSVYSMEGDQAPIQQMCDLAERYKVMTYLDEVHAVGVYGKGGAGLAKVYNQQQRLTLIQGNFSKGFGSYGGYITSHATLVDFIRSYASPFIFTTSLPPSVVATSLEALHILKENPQLQQQLHDRVIYLKNYLTHHAIPFVNHNTHIITLMIGDAKKCQEISNCLLHEHGCYVQPINYPTVKRGQERLRITLTPQHTPDMIEQFVKALQNVLTNA